jgi:hypothetical protein
MADNDSEVSHQVILIHLTLSLQPTLNYSRSFLFARSAAMHAPQTCAIVFILSFTQPTPQRGDQAVIFAHIVKTPPLRLPMPIGGDGGSDPR